MPLSRKFLPTVGQQAHLLVGCFAALSLGSSPAAPEEPRLPAQAAGAEPQCEAGDGLGCEAEDAGFGELLLLQTRLSVERPGRSPPEPPALAAAAKSSPAALRPSCHTTGEGPSSSEVRHIGDVRHLKVSSGIVAHVSVGENVSLTITGYTNLLPRVEAKEHGNELRLYLRRRTCNSNVEVALTLRGPVRGLKTDTGAQVEIDTVGGLIVASEGSRITAQRMDAPSMATVLVSDNSSVSLAEGTLGATTVVASSDAHVDFGAAEARSVMVTATGGAEVSGLVARGAMVVATGGATVNITASETASVGCVGTGSGVRISGNSTIAQLFEAGGCFAGAAQ